MASKTLAIRSSTLTSNRAGPSAKAVGPNSVSFTYGCNRRRAVRLPVVRAQVTGDGKDATRTQGQPNGERKDTQRAPSSGDKKDTAKGQATHGEKKDTARAAPATEEKRDTAIDVHVSSRGNQQQQQEGQAVEVRPRRQALDLSPFGESTFSHRGGVI